jgi:hypothetical protein
VFLEVSRDTGEPVEDGIPGINEAFISGTQPSRQLPQ